MQSRIHNKTFALKAFALKCSYGALYQALNKTSVSDLSASAEQEIRKNVAVLASLVQSRRDEEGDQTVRLPCEESFSIIHESLF
jgi:hypothetical protein